MERLTYDFYFHGEHCNQVKGADNLMCDEVCRKVSDKGCKCCPIAKAFDRLGEIEDILGDDYDLDHLRELVEANRDGRCVVLPCKIGTPVYRILWHCGCAALDDESYKYVCFPVPFTFDMINQFGKSVFLTREEAEEAMKEREEDEG